MLAATALPPADRQARPAPVPARPPAPVPPGGPSFANLLQRGQASHGVMPAPVPSRPGDAESPAEPNGEPLGGGDASSEVQSAARPQAQAKGTKAGARLRDKAPSSAPATKTSSPLPSPAAAEQAADETAALPGAAGGAATSPPPPTTVLPSELRNWMAGWQLPGAGASGAADRADPSLAATTAAGLSTAASASVAAAGSKPGPAELSQQGVDDAAVADAATTPTSASALPAGQAGEPSAVAAAERHALPPEAPRVQEAPQALLAGAAGAVPRGFDAATLAPTALPVPLYSPEFAQALGVQVSVLARDGVQRAELHLNPAEMGPISVQIELEGREARVDFHAHAAATREVIERGLPELATALREQGMTLAGGGVFEQSPGSHKPPGGETGSGIGRTQWTAPGATPAATAPTRLHVPQGALDLYA